MFFYADPSTILKGILNLVLESYNNYKYYFNVIIFVLILLT